MAYIVSIFGALITLIGLVGIVVPRYFIEVIGNWEAESRFIAAVGIRMVMGVICLSAAPASRMPVVVQVIGIIAIAAAAVALLVGLERLNRLIDWWLERPPIVVRMSAAFAAGFGILLVFAGA